MFTSVIFHPNMFLVLFKIGIGPFMCVIYIVEPHSTTEHHISMTSLIHWKSCLFEQTQSDLDLLIIKIN